ncbi:MAG: monovalent cation/H(+) antiporter subunit G [Candidatus Binatia bacterium]
MSLVTEIVASLLLLIGLGFTLIGSIGLVRLPDFYTRMHAPTKATTLGVSSMLAAAALVLPGSMLATALKASLAIVFFFLTAPIGAHMLARAALRGEIRPARETHVFELPPQPVERKGEGPAGR